MKVSFVFNGNPISEGLREYFSHRANLALRKYRRHIQSLKVSLDDAINPRVGTRLSCRVEMTGDFGTRVIIVHDRSFKSAIDCALGVCSEVAERALHRADAEMSAIAFHRKLAS